MRILRNRQRRRNEFLQNVWELADGHGRGPRRRGRPATGDLRGVQQADAERLCVLSALRAQARGTCTSGSAGRARQREGGSRSDDHVGCSSSVDTASGHAATCERHPPGHGSHSGEPRARERRARSDDRACLGCASPRGRCRRRRFRSRFLRGDPAGPAAFGCHERA